MLHHRWIENEIRLNLLGLMNTYIASARQMVKQDIGGRIVGAGSIASYRTAGTSCSLISDLNASRVVYRKPGSVWSD